ncbi:GRP family sugar transporter [Enterococcus sp. HY326]|uniref:GRP family sugar transporter n=1 Tax=Enterococcus sp. HY326 TaxID=2971265 RepID=UPI00223EEE3A|nr:GRP family sugar transporter [Enterococcus sp. HY326]
MNILIALIPALGWGIQPLIIGKIGGKPANQILGTGIGALVIGLIVEFAFSPGNISLVVFLISLLSGAFWVIGQTGQYKSLELMGVSSTMPVTTGLQLIGTSLISVIAFGEWPTLTNKLIGLGAIILLIVGAIFTSVSDSASTKDRFKHGFIILLFTSIGYWIYSALPKMVDASGLAIFFPQMLGVFLGALIYVLVTDRKAIVEKTSWQTSLVGLTFSISALAYIFSAQENGVATAFIITQLNVVVATLGGMFFLKEKKSPRELRSTLIGLALIVVGSIITIFI